MSIDKLEVFASQADKNTDGLTLKYGFPSAEKPARQWFNWLFYTQTAKINEVVDLTNTSFTRIKDMEVKYEQLRRDTAQQLQDTQSSLQDVREYADQLMQTAVGGKLAYKTYAEMIADKSNIAAKSSIDIIADTDDKNGTYLYDGTDFVKSQYDIEKIIRAKVQNTFGTHAQMVASNLSDGSYALVAEDVGDKNGLYVKTAGAWVKSDYDPLGKANKNQDANTLATFGASLYRGTYTESFVSSGLSKDSRNTDGFVIDTVGSRIFTQKYMEVFDSEGTRYRAPEQEVAWVTDGTTSEAFAMLYLNKTTKLFSVINLKNALSEEDKKDLLLCAILTRYAEKISFVSNAPFSIDYGINGVSIAHEKADINPSVSAPINKQLPNYDTSNQTLTFPSDTVFKYRDITFTTKEVIVVNTKNPDQISSIVYVYWDLVTNDLVVKRFNTVLSASERYRWVLVATIRDSYITTPSSGPWQGRVSLDMNCEFTINGFSRFEKETTLEATVIPASVGRDGFGNLPNYNTETKSFEFSWDTIFRSGDSIYIVPDGGLVVSCVDPNNLSSAVIVYWNKVDNTFHIRRFNHVLKSNEITDFVKVAAVRDTLITPSSAHWSTRLGIDTTMMYTINGIHPYLGDPNKESEGVLSIDVHSEPMVRACAHRGFNGQYLAPENTLPAFKMAADYGFWGAETDLRLTSDGHWVLMHDDTIDRTTTGTGAVADLTLDQIRSFDANHGKPEYVGVKVPTLEEFLTTCKRHNIVPYMQTYVTPDAVSIIPLAKAIREITGEQGTVVISFSSTHLYFIREHLPKMPVELLVSTITESNIATAKLIGNCSLGCSRAGVNKTDIALAAKSGVRVSMWAESIDPEKFIDMNVLRVTSDFAIPPDFNKGFQKLLIKNKADWSNFTKSSAFTGTVTNGAITIPPTQDVSINLGSHPLGVLIVEFYATSTSEDSEMFVYAGRDIKTGVINSLSPTHKFSCLIRNNVEADVVVTFKGVTGTLTLQDLKIKVFEV